MLFFSLVAFAIAIAGGTAFVIFWPLALVHIRDRHPQITAKLGHGAFLKPRALLWLLRGDYRNEPDPRRPDRDLSGLATPSRISLLVILSSIVLGGVLWLVATGMQ